MTIHTPLRMGFGNHAHNRWKWNTFGGEESSWPFLCIHVWISNGFKLQGDCLELGTKGPWFLDPSLALAVCSSEDLSLETKLECWKNIREALELVLCFRRYYSGCRLDLNGISVRSCQGRRDRDSLSIVRSARGTDRYQWKKRGLISGTIASILPWWVAFFRRLKSIWDTKAMKIFVHCIYPRTIIKRNENSSIFLEFAFKCGEENFSGVVQKRYNRFISIKLEFVTGISGLLYANRGNKFQIGTLKHWKEEGWPLATLNCSNFRLFDKVGTRKGAFRRPSSFSPLKKSLKWAKSGTRRNVPPPLCDPRMCSVLACWLLCQSATRAASEDDKLDGKS